MSLQTFAIAVGIVLVLIILILIIIGICLACRQLQQQVAVGKCKVQDNTDNKLYINTAVQSTTFQ